MSALLASIARSLATHWKRGAIALVVVVVAIAFLGSALASDTTDNFSTPGTESQQAIDLLREKFPAASGDTGTVVFTAKDGGTLTAGPERAAVQKTVADLAKLPHVTTVTDPLQADSPALSKDQHTGFAVVQYDIQAIDLGKSEAQKLEDTARAAAGTAVGVELRGQVVDQAAQQDAPIGELIGVAIAIVLLTLLFRSIAAMLVTLVGALVGVMISQLVLRMVAGPLGLPDFATTLAVMLGLGAGIDYALLIVSRFREQLAAGESPPEAAARASATSGTSVVAAGLIVMVAIAGLLAIGIPFVGKMGVGSAIAIAFVVISSLTVLPIGMGALAKRLKPKRPQDVGRSAAFTRWGERVTRRPWVALVGGGLVLLVIAIPFTDMRLGSPDDGNQAAKMTQRKAYDELSAAFGPGFNGPLSLAVAPANGGKLDDADMAGLRAAVAKTPNVKAVGEPRLNPAGDAAIISVTPRTSPQDVATSDLVHRLRDTTIPPAERAAGLQVYVGGPTAILEDLSAKISARLPLFIGVVIGLSVLLLMAVFRSIWVPLASAVFNLLSIGAAYGVTVAVFQWGWGASLLGVGSDVPIISFVPLMMFAVLFGLSMDYNVFLQSRIREAYFEGDSPRESVVHGLSRIAKVILVAGLVMASVFLAFIIGDDVVTKMFGLGLGSAILIDVLIVRMIVTPALMTVLGDRAWWFPAWLDRLLPNVSLEGGHDDRHERVSGRAAPEAG
jgi:putative drug exporter of the RND superfamily